MDYTANPKLKGETTLRLLPAQANILNYMYVNPTKGSQSYLRLLALRTRVGRLTRIIGY